MAKVTEYAHFLSEELGPRPTGTEEEQQAALFITEKLQRDAGLPAVIEDFNSESEYPTGVFLCYLLVFVLTLVTMFVEVLALPALIVSVLAAVIVFFEANDKPIISKFSRKGISQNVVAKYDPNYGKETNSNRSRKIVLVAHYDSSRTRNTLNGPLFGLIPLLNQIALYAIVACPVLLLIKYVILAHSVGVLAIILTILTVLVLLGLFIRIAQGIMFKFAKYNNGANNNASGVAVMMDLANRINNYGETSPYYGKGTYDVTIHGKEAAYDAGVVPEGARLEYDDDVRGGAGARAGAAAAAAAGIAAGGALVAVETAAAAEAIDPNSPEAGLLAAKAAIAAMTGKPVSMTTNYAKPAAPEAAVAEEPQVAELETTQGEAETEVAYDMRRLESPSEETAETINDGVAPEAAVAEGAQAQEVVEEAAPAVVEEPQEEKSSVPEWFKRAQQKAHRQEEVEVKRSMFNDALEAANNASSAAGESESGFINASIAPAEALVEVMGGAAETAEAAEAAAQAAMPEEVPAGEVVAETVDAAPVAPKEEAVPESFEAEAAPVKKSPEEMTLQDKLAQMRENIMASGPQPKHTPKAEAPAPEPVEVAQAEEAAPEEEVAFDNPVIEETIKEEAPAPVEKVERPMFLPNINTSNLTPISQEEMHQRAPLAEVASHGKHSKGLLNMLPDIDTDNPNVDSMALPGFDEEEEMDDFSSSAPQVAAGMTGAFTAVSGRLMDEADEEEDMYIEDADDSVYDDGFTEYGAYAGQSYVEMPKEKKGIFSRLFGRKKKEEELSTSEWLGVDENFDAREVGAARGGWESFREDGYDDGYDGYNGGYDDGYGQGGYDAGYGQGGYDDGYDDGYGGYDDEYDDGYEAGEGGAYTNISNSYDDGFYIGEDKESYHHDRWNGGAFGKLKLGKKNKQQEAEYDDYDGYDDGYDGYDDGYSDGYEGDYAGYEQGDYAPDFRNDAMEQENPEPIYDDFYMKPNDNSEALKEIFEFKSNSLDTEVWFVALGSQLANQSGMRSFLAQHEKELHGAVIIEIDAVGAGELSLVMQEGRYKKVATSSRMKRLVEKAASSLGLHIGTGNVLYSDSAASYAAKRGHQAMHLVGMANGKPAMIGQSDDTFDALDEQLMLENEEIILELMKNV